MPWTPVTGLTSPNTIPASVNARLVVLDLLINRILANTNEEYSNETRLSLRSNAQNVRGTVREIRNDLGIT